MSGCDHKFIDSNRCAKCGVSLDTLRVVDLAVRDGLEQPAPPSTYTDDVIEVMRATITGLREQVAHLKACNDQLRIAETELNRELAKVRAQRDEAEQLRQNALAYWVPKSGEGM